MIYLMHGTDHEKARDKTRVLTEALQKKKPDALFYRITTQNYSENPVDSLVAGQGLFESKYIVFYDNIFESKELKEEVVSALKEIKESDNIFIFLEKEIDKKTLDKITKHAEKVQEYAASGETKKKKEYNPFAISDALLSRDKKRLWILLLEAKKKGNAAEEIHGIIWWQVKVLKIVSVSKDAKEAELSPFVFSKAKAAAGNFSKEQIDGMLADLVDIYHDAHRGEKDFWVELEKWGLGL